MNELFSILFAILGLIIGWLAASQRAKIDVIRAEEKLAAIEDGKDAMTAQMENVATQVSRQNSEDFLKLAEERLGNEIFKNLISVPYKWHLLNNPNITRNVIIKFIKLAFENMNYQLKLNQILDEFEKKDISLDSHQKDITKKILLLAIKIKDETPFRIFSFVFEN